MKGLLSSGFLACCLALPGCTGVVSGGNSGQSGTASGNGSFGNTGNTGPAGTGSDNGAAGGGSGGTASTAPWASVAEPSTPTVSRLSTLQWANSIRALLQLSNPGDLDNALTPDAVLRFDNEADSLFVSQALHDDLQTQAESLAAQVTADPTAVARLVPANAPTDATGKATAYITDFGRKAFRRPLTTAEVQTYLTLFNQGPTLTTGMKAFEAGMRVTLEAFLQSPYFVYRTGFGGAATSGKARLTDYEIAANLAYALTNSPPDTTLAGLADQGGLKTTDAIRAQAKRLLPSDNGKSAVDRFFFQYFGLGQYDTLQKNPTTAPQFTAATGPQLHAEAQQLLQYLFAQNLGLADIFTTKVGFVNAPVAKLYGLSGTFTDSAWTQVSFDNRPGVLARLGFLAYYGHEALQDSIHRGVNINARILCHQMSPPPNLVIPPLPAQTLDETNRQVVSSFTNACGHGCHDTNINPAGFAFENFDGLGQYQTTDNGQTIDSSGTYTFESGVTKSFANLDEFTKVLASSDQAHACYTEKWAADLYERVPRLADENAAHALAEQSASSHLSSQDVVLALVSDDAFVTRVEGSQ
jgi:hypothetical protein